MLEVGAVEFPEGLLEGLFPIWGGEGRHDFAGEGEVEMPALERWPQEEDRPAWRKLSRKLVRIVESKRLSE